MDIEYNPTEYIKTNIIGSQNLIEESIKNNVKKLVALSTDKPRHQLARCNKTFADKIFLASNNFYGKSTFSVVRYQMLILQEVRCYLFFGTI